MSSMGVLTFFLGLHVTQKDDGIFISQEKYVDEILKIASTPMETSKPLMKDENAKDVDVYLYRSMIGSLMYLSSSRPDIMFVVCACARFQVTPKVLHLHDVKRIFRYLKGQPKLGLWYPKDSLFDLEAYTDSDYASASLDRKSTTGGCQFLRSRLISWQCKKQTIVSNSTTEAEYVAATNSNEKKLIQMIKIHTDQNVVDVLTKAFNVGRFQYRNASIGISLTSEVWIDEPITDEAANEEHVPIHSNDPLLSGKDRLKLNELMELCTNLSQRVLDLENIKTSQAAEIAKLKERVKKLERRNKSRTLGLKRLRKVGRSAQVVSSEDEEVTLVDEAQKRIDDNLMFDTGVFDKQEVEVEKVVSTAEVTIASATTTTIDELTLAQTLIKIKAAKPKVVTTAATTTTTVAKDKGKGKMVEPEKPLKKKDQILVDEEIAQRLQEELQAELEEEERLARQKEEEDNLNSWDNTQAMMEADYELAQRLQAEEQGELTIE
ncbi:hypothetical protein Tco_0128308 [Tanacetum coccineum]